MTTTQMPVGPLTSAGSPNISDPWRNYLSPLTAISWDTTGFKVNLGSVSPVVLTQTTVTFNAGSLAALSLGQDLSFGLGTHAVSLGAVDYGSFVIGNTSAGTGGPQVILVQQSASPAAGDDLGAFIFYGKDSAANNQNYASITCKILDPTSTSEDSALRLRVIGAGADIDAVTVGPGVQVGAPTGGDKGTGTVNAASGMYDAGRRVGGILLLSGSAAAAASLNLNFSAYFSEFNMIEIILTDLTTNSGTTEEDILARVSSDGTTFLSTASYNYRYQYWSAATFTTNIAQNDTSVSSWVFFKPSWGTANAVTMRIYKPSSAVNCVFHLEGNGFDSASAIFSGNAWGWSPVVPTKGVQFLPQWGTTITCDYRVVGYI